MSEPIKAIYAPEHSRMLKALTDDKAVVVYHRSGPTWNDGGAWHRIVARLTDGTHVSIKMESDYAPDVLIVELLKQWPPMDDKDARIADLERQLDASLMELAETQALELQHGAVIERLTRQLAERKCPVGISPASHMLCSAGTCDVCTTSRQLAEARDKALEEAAEALIECSVWCDSQDLTDAGWHNGVIDARKHHMDRIRNLKGTP